MDDRPRQDLHVLSPWLNASGSLGFDPRPDWPWPQPQGAFVTNAVSRRPRRPAEQPRALDYPSGVLLHSGYPNPGVRQVIRRHARRWAESGLPVWVHLLAEEPVGVEEMVRGLEGLEGVAALEIGLPPAASSEENLALLEAARGELPVVACANLNCVREPWVAKLPKTGASAVTITAPRGALPAGGKKTGTGRLYGSGLFPQALEAVAHLARLGLPVIAGCGVFSVEAGQALLDAGAWAVQVDLALWQLRG